MAAWGYEFYLLAAKSISRIRSGPSSHVISSMSNKEEWTNLILKATD